jgi:hypothetical protein
VLSEVGAANGLAMAHVIGNPIEIMSIDDFLQHCRKSGSGGGRAINQQVRWAKGRLRAGESKRRRGRWHYAKQHNATMPAAMGDVFGRLA